MGVTSKSRALVVAALLTAAAAASATAGTYEIKNDPGGNIGQHQTKYQAIAAKGDDLRVSGKCASACTVIFASFARDKICVTPSGFFGFHTGNDGKRGADGAKGASFRATDAMLNSYPPDIIAWINARGGLSPGMMWMRAPETYKFFRKC